MSYSDIPVAFVTRKLREDPSFQRKSLLLFASLHREVRRDPAVANEFSHCDLSEANWRLLKPIIDVLSEGVTPLTKAQQAEMLDVLLDHAEMLAMILRQDEVQAELDRDDEV